MTDTGDRAGAEVVQIYVGDVAATVARPVRELKGFRRVELEPGEHVRIEAGDFTIGVGTSPRHFTETKTITLDAPFIGAPLGPDSTLHEWLADPRGREVLSGDELASSCATTSSSR